GPLRIAAARARQLRWQLDPQRSQRWLHLPALLRVAAPTSAITLSLAGIYNHWSDALLVAAIVSVEGAVRAGVLGHLPTGWIKLTGRFSAVVRFLIGILIGYLGYLVTSLVLPNSPALHTSRPVLSGALLALTAFHLLFPRWSSIARTVR